MAARTKRSALTKDVERWLAVAGWGSVILIQVGIAITAAAQQPVPASFVFDRVTVIDVERGKRLPAQRVVIVGNRIQAVGPLDQVRMPRGAQVVDARGKYLIPGLWDMHVHSYRTDFFRAYPLYIASGVTGIRDAGTLNTFPVETLRLWRQEVLAGTRVGPPRQILSGLMMESWHHPRRARRLVDSLVAAGIDMLKLHNLRGSAAYFAFAAEARRAGVPFGGHAQWVWPRDASDSGARIIDHLVFTSYASQPAGQSRLSLNEACWGDRPTASVERCQPIADHFRRHNTWVVPTLLFTHGAGRATPRGTVMNPRFFKALHAFMSDSVRPSDWLRRALVLGDRAGPRGHTTADSLGFMYIMQRSGLPMLAGTDMSVTRKPSTLMAAGFSLHGELALYVAEGLTPLTALQSATLNPAKMLRATDSLGTVAPGKLADLVLLDADPLADITNTTTIRAVVASGRYFDRAALDSLLAEVRAKGP